MGKGERTTPQYYYMYKLSHLLGYRLAFSGFGCIVYGRNGRTAMFAKREAVLMSSSVSQS